MSWSIRVHGKPEAVAQALRDHSDKLSGQSKQEYDEALPHLIDLVKQNIGLPIDVNASGHATFASSHPTLRDGVRTYGNCLVEIKHLEGTHVG